MEQVLLMLDVSITYGISAFVRTNIAFNGTSFTFDEKSVTDYGTNTAFDGMC